MNVERLNIQSGISITSKEHGKAHHSFHSESMFAVTMPHGMEINGMGNYLKKHNIFDCSCLYEEPEESAFQKALAFTFIYKSLFTDLEETAVDNTTVSLVCGKNSEEFFQYLDESGYPVNQSGNGIYQINICMPVHAYVIVMPELVKPECNWLASLIRLAGGKCQEKYIICSECSFHTAEF